MIKIDIISGFLGAGKTTLIKKLFEGALKEEQVVIIENEFGEIGIDGSFLKGAGVQIKEINAGCICCSLVGDFASSIREIIDTYHPDRILIEPSGVGKLSDIVAAVQSIGSEELRLNILATVVDGPKAKVYLKNFGEFFVNQIEAADTIVISKVDKISAETIDGVVHMLKEKNPHANIVTTPIASFESAALLRLLEEKASLEHRLLEETLEEAEHHDHCGCHHHDEEHEEHCCHHDHEEHHHGHEENDHEHEEHDHEEHCCHHDHEHGHHHHHDADEVFASWGIETARSIAKSELEDFLAHLAHDEDLGTIVRAKGILKAADCEGWYYFDFVSGDYEIRLGDPDYTGRIVVIGAHLNEEKVAALFRKQ